MSHDHSNPIRQKMKASRKDVEQLIASSNGNPRFRGAKMILTDGQMTMTCRNAISPS